jgi:hypothetical protein
MAGLSDFFKPRALLPEEKRRWFGVVRRLADELRIPRDQLLAFGQELFGAARSEYLAMALSSAEDDRQA